MRAGDLVQSLVIEVISTHCRGELIEISDHRAGEIQVEFPARDIADPESVPDALWDEDERPGRTRELAVLQIHDVLALEDIERLGRVVMYVYRWSKAGRFLRLQHGYGTTCLVSVRLERHTELAQVDEPPFARADYERSLVTRHGRTRGCHAGIRASKPPPRRAPAKERENALCSCPGPCEPRELAAHAIDLRAVHEELAFVRATSFAQPTHEYETLQVQDQVVELAKAVAQSDFGAPHAASSNATTSPSTNRASAPGAGGDLPGA